MNNQNMKLPDNVLAFKLLDSASVSENQRQICLTLVDDLTYNSMKGALKHIFGDKIINISKDEEYYWGVNVKQEESAVIFEQNKNFKKKLNLVNKQGEIARCIICDSQMHWGKRCKTYSKAVNKTYSKAVSVMEAVSENDNKDNEEVNILMVN